MLDNRSDLNILIKSGGDVASGTIYRLYKSGFRPVVCEIPKPTMVRRTVSFGEAIYQGQYNVEGVEAVYVKNKKEFENVLEEGSIPIFVVDLLSYFENEFKPDIIIDGRMMKRKNDTEINDASLVIGLGPGFTAGEDVDAVIETCRGHYLGRAIYEGEAAPYTGSPGEVMGISKKRVIYADRTGKFESEKEIGQHIESGEVFGYIDREPIKAEISGIIRGQIFPDREVKKDWKIGDIDPRDNKDHCYKISDKALAIAGGVLEAVLNLSSKIEKGRQ